MTINELKIAVNLLREMLEEKDEFNLKFAALVIDRFCLWLFSIVTLFSTFIIFVSAKNFFNFS